MHPFQRVISLGLLSALQCFVMCERTAWFPGITGTLWQIDNIYHPKSLFALESYPTDYLWKWWFRFHEGPHKRTDKKNQPNCCCTLPYCTTIGVGRKAICRTKSLRRAWDAREFREGVCSCSQSCLVSPMSKTRLWAWESRLWAKATKIAHNLASHSKNLVLCSLSCILCS